MQRTKDRGIILRRKPFGEADIMVTIYTEKNGKVRALAKSARKISSKLAGYTELFTTVSFQLDFKSSIPILSQVAHDRLFDGIADNPLLYQQLHMVAEIIDKGCEEREHNSALYTALEKGLAELVTSQHPLVVSALILKLTAILGFAPQLTRCAHCGEAITEDQELGWSEAHGGIVSGLENVAVAVPLTTEEAKVLRYLPRLSYEALSKIKVSGDTGRKIERLLLNHAQFSLEKDFIAPRIGRELQYEYVD